MNGRELPSSSSVIQKNGLPRKSGLSRSQINLSDVGLSAVEIDLSIQELRGHLPLHPARHVANGTHFGQGRRPTNAPLPLPNGHPQSLKHKGFYQQREQVTYHRVSYQPGFQTRALDDQRIPYSYRPPPFQPPPVPYFRHDPLKQPPTDPARIPDAKPVFRDCDCGHRTPSYRSSVSSEESAPSPLRPPPLYEASVRQSPLFLQSPPEYGAHLSRPSPVSSVQATSPGLALTAVKAMEVAKPYVQHAVAPEVRRKSATPVGTYQTPSPLGEYVQEPVGVLATGRCEPVVPGKFRGGVTVMLSPEVGEESQTATPGEFVRRWNNPYAHFSADAYKFYVEQHIDAIMKGHASRGWRRMKLEREMATMRLAEHTANECIRRLTIQESNYLRRSRVKLNRAHFEPIRKIGVGAFGEVSLVRKVGTELLYAMKTLRKAHILEKKQIGHVMAERDILAAADIEWVVKLFYSFQDAECLYFVMEYVPGGDLMSLLVKLGQFDEQLARFYIAELVMAIGSVHAIGFIHRDIKPDNILIDRQGHLKLTDFGLCTGFHWTHKSQNYNLATPASASAAADDSIHVRSDSLAWQHREAVRTVEGGANRSRREPRRGIVPRRGSADHGDMLKRLCAHSQVGTPNYMAPEVLLSSDNAGYTQVCDWWSVGVILYEMLCGRPPFYAKTAEETQEKVIYWQRHLDVDSYSLSAEARDLILCLCTDAEQRLGNGASPYAPPFDPGVPSTVRGCEEIKNHPFLFGMDFRTIRKQQSPFVPQLQHELDTSNFEEFDETPSPVEGAGTGEWSQVQPFLHFTFRRFFDIGGEEERRAYPPRPGVKEPPRYEEAVREGEGTGVAVSGAAAAAGEAHKKAKEAVYV